MKKYPFSLSKANIIYAVIYAVFIIFMNIKIYGFDAFAFGYSFGSILGIIIIPTLLALLFWFALGKKEKGGTTTFNIVLTLMVIGSISEFGNIISDRQKPVDDIEKAVADFKGNSSVNPDSTDIYYRTYSNEINSAMDALLKSSVGEERKVFTELKNYLDKVDSVSIVWSEAHIAFAEPRIMDFTILDNTQEYDFQKKVIQNYIDSSEDYKEFVENRVAYLTSHTKHVNRNSDVYKGFIKGITKKDSLQQPIFIPYIRAHANYGKDMLGIINLLEKENGNWHFDDDEIIIQNPESQERFDSLVNSALYHEKIVNELSVKLVDIM